MAAKAKCKRCERDFEIQGMAFLTDNGLKTANTTESTTEERCPNCGYIATYDTKEILWDN
jgi:DNA-directed RNA polymerase subunit RPC12/RpoP